MKRAVITGIGIVSPIGIGVHTFWDNLLSGKTGVDFIKQFDASSFPSKIAAEVKGFDAEEYLDRDQIRFYSKVTKFACAAAKMALEDAELTTFDPIRTDVVMGSAFSSLYAVEQDIQANPTHGREFSRGTFSKKMFYHIVTHAPACAIALMIKSEGYVTSISSACISGINAIGTAAERIKDGKAKIVLTGGVDTPISRLMLGYLSNSNFVSEERQHPENALCPFDKRRTKSVLGEGAGVFVLEELEHAKARNARIYGEIVSFAQGTENTSELFMEDKSAKNWVNLIGKLTRNKKKIDLVNAHGPSDSIIDKVESTAIQNSLLQGNRKLKVTSIKGATGSPFAAAGAFQVAAAAMSLRTKYIPPTYNYKIPDPQCNLNIVTEKQHYKKLKSILVNSHGMGGLNSCLLLKEVRT